MDVVETSNDRSRVSVFGDAAVCANGLAKVSGACDEAVEILSGCLTANDGGLANCHDDLALYYDRRWEHRCHARGVVVICVFC